MTVARKIDKGFRVTEFYSAHDYQWDSDFYFAGEQHIYWEIVYVLSGEVESVEDERIYHLHGGEMLLHAPMEFHTIRSFSGSAPHVYIFSFLAEGELPESLKGGSFRLSEELRTEYGAFFARARRFFCGEGGKEEGILCGARLTLFLLKLSMETGRAQLSETPSAKVYQKVVGAMREGVCQNLTLEEIGEQCHVSVSTIKHLFGQYAGVSPKNYYAKMRFDEAVRLLKEGVPIPEVADRMNFSSPNYFSVFIKRQSGLPPARFLREEEKKER